jgi:hypothetical protein
MPKLVSAEVEAKLDEEIRSQRGDSLASSLTPQGGGAFLERQLQQVLATVLEQPRAPLNGFMLFPLGTNVSPGAATYIQRVRNSVGSARVGGSAADDPPTSDVEVTEFPMATAPIYTGFQYSIEEIATNLFAGGSLPTDRASAAQRSDLQTHNEIMFNGDAKHGLFGMLMHPLIPRTVLAARPTTAADALSMLNQLVNRVHVRTQGLAGRLRVVLPTDLYAFIASEPRSTTSDTTVLSFFLQNNPHVLDVKSYHEGDGRGTGGSDVIMAYPPVADVLTYEVPRMWTPLPVQAKNYVMKVPCSSKSGGMHIKVPFYCELVEVPAAA